mgnify:CR=1 FL=1
MPAERRAPALAARMAHIRPFHVMKLLARARVFLYRAGTVIFSVAVIVWALAYFPRAPADEIETIRAEMTAVAEAEGTGVTDIENRLAALQLERSLLDLERARQTIAGLESNVAGLEQNLGNLQARFSDAQERMGELAAGTRVVVPEPLKDFERFVYGDTVIEVRRFGTAHSPGDISVWVPEKRVVIAGDIRHSRVARSNAFLLTRMGAEVRFGGVKAGKVVEIGTDPDDRSRIRVVFEVPASFPVNHGSVATIDQISLTNDAGTYTRTHHWGNLGGMVIKLGLVGKF